MKRPMKWFIAALSLVLLISLSKPTYAVTEEAWEEAVTVYGAALQSNADMQNTTKQLLGTKDNDKVAYVNAADLGKYLNLQSSDNVLKSSIRIKKLAKGSGLTLNIDESKGKITKITEDTYKNALLTAGVTDADVKIAAAEDVTGESALAGVYKAFETQGEAIDQGQTQAAQNELDSITSITEENQNVDGFSQEQLNKAIAEAKAEIAKQGGNLSVTEIKNVVVEKINNNGLNNVLNDNQINIIVNFINNAQQQGVFTGDNANKIIDSATGYVNDIKNSDTFKNAADKAKDAGKELKNSLDEQGVWDKFVAAIQSFFNAIANFFKSIFS
ncbi:DUF1002 domain-containing protein [Macrococcus hajekii]|uniref:DUF1002 domain-containing protein n=1 Tax=Macrococcus hajekii TaxID=198482 RepID=A0A4R6BMM2_9STAP|nr:DUF1002 domain-containing protein [Macrococcus hajekii]TDM03070.1 DUF1002 domain-containing protein [Macrococcus hajekii]GGB06318.1 hypothetical protein GCM10007190_12960 [Macrococcus hajekii]